MGGVGGGSSPWRGGAPEPEGATISILPILKTIIGVEALRPPEAYGSAVLCARGGSVCTRRFHVHEERS